MKRYKPCKCAKCNGTGQHAMGRCFACNGKGFQELRDKMRQSFYNARKYRAES